MCVLRLGEIAKKSFLGANGSTQLGVRKQIGPPRNKHGPNVRFWPKADRKTMQNILTRSVGPKLVLILQAKRGSLNWALHL